MAPDRERILLLQQLRQDGRLFPRLFFVDLTQKHKLGLRNVARENTHAVFNKSAAHVRIISTVPHQLVFHENFTVVFYVNKRQKKKLQSPTGKL